MQRRFVIALASALFISAAAIPAAFSAGGGGGSGSDNSQCTGGKVWDKKLKKCVDPQRGQIDDDSIFEAGRYFAENGRYDDAINILTLAANKEDPRILNYLGYSHRKAGRITVGLGYYQEALRANPDYTLVREYLGEAYLQLGDVDAARGQLAEIEKRCGTGCAEHAELERQIEAFTTRG